MSNQIGYLIEGKNVMCLSCADRTDLLRNNPDACKLYDVNIGDYKQTCHTCHKVLVQGKTPAWCELFAPARLDPEGKAEPKMEIRGSFKVDGKCKDLRGGGADSYTLIRKKD